MQLATKAVPSAGEHHDAEHAREECSALAVFLGAFGAFVAVIANIAMKRDVSTVGAVKDALSVLFETPIPVYGAAMLFILIGVVLVIVAKTTDRGKAFYSGLSATAIIMTAVPQSIQPTIATGIESNRSQPTEHAAAIVHERSLLDFFLSSASAQSAAGAATGKITLQLTTADGASLPSVTVSIRNAETTALIARSRITASSLTLFQPPGNYLIVVDADSGYQQYVSQIQVRENASVAVAVQLQTTNLPAIVQRLGRKY